MRIDRALAIGMGWFPDEAGGLGRYYRELVTRLGPSGVACDGLVTGDADVTLAHGGRVRGFAPASAGLIARLSGLRAAVRARLRSDRPDVTISHFALYGWPVLDLLRDLPLVVHFHGPWAEESRVEGAGRASSWLKARIERAVYSRATRVIVLSEFYRELVERRYGVAPERVRVIPGGVDHARFAVGESRREARVRLGWPTDRPILVAVRRLAARMGLEALVDAVARLRARFPDLLLVIAGRGALADRLAARIRAAHLERHVRLAGFVPDEALPLVYRAADASVVPSESLEGFGLTVLESLAAGTPVVGTAVGGIPEILRPLDARLLAERASPDALCESLGALLDGGGPDDARCRAYARERFAWEGVAERVGAVYREAARA